MVTAISLSLYGDVSARTWYIKADGTGDAPTIWAGLDSSVAGDTVLVGPGTYEQSGGITMKDGIILTSEAGPFETKLVPEAFSWPLASMYCEYFRAVRTEISGFWFDGFLATGSGFGVIWINNCYQLYIKNNILTNNRDGIVITDWVGISSVWIENNTIVGHLENGFEGVLNNGYITNNIIWDRATHVGGSLIAYCNDFLDLSDAEQYASINFQADPQFCGPGAGNYFLQADSPCIRKNMPPPFDTYCDTFVGALPEGCGGVPVEKKTWGAIKSIYQ